MSHCCLKRKLGKKTFLHGNHYNHSVFLPVKDYFPHSAWQNVVVATFSRDLGMITVFFDRKSFSYKQLWKKSIIIIIVYGDNYILWM